MILVLSGEGPTDLGRCNTGSEQCQDKAFDIGPMAVITDKLIEEKIGYSLRSIPEAIHFVSKKALVAWSKAQRTPRMPSLRGLQTQVETRYFFFNARALGEIAKDIQDRNAEQPVIAILFRDTDGTCSAPSQLWRDKHKSIMDGFESVPFMRGIPMLPKPKSEAWLLCAIREPSYQHCRQLEDISGNDKASNPAKDQLQNTMQTEPSRETLIEWIESHGFRWEAVSEQMPSFQSFTIRLNEILDQIIRPSREGSAQ